MKRKKIGIYGGSFNPIHFGHLNLAIELKEKKELDEVWVVPAHLSPFAKQQTTISAQHRLTMVKKALSEIPNFQTLDVEIKRSAPSYTIDTIEEILEKNREEAAFFLMIGDDNIPRLSDWKEIKKIIHLISLLVGTRSGSDIKEKLSKLSFPDPLRMAIEKGMVITNRLEISATVIRERLKRKLYCGHLVPAKVLDYIYENQLYFTLDLCS